MLVPDDIVQTAKRGDTAMTDHRLVFFGDLTIPVAVCKLEETRSPVDAEILQPLYYVEGLPDDELILKNGLIKSAKGDETARWKIPVERNCPAQIFAIDDP